MEPNRVPHPTVKLHKPRGELRLAAQIRATVARQGGVGTFRLYGRSGARIGERLEEVLKHEFEVTRFLSDPEQSSAHHRDGYERYVTELRVRSKSG